MSSLVWNKKYEIGEEAIDKEHKQLFSTLSKLLKISEDDEKSEWACKEGIKYLKNHTIEHFGHEEDYMRSIAYEDFEIHKRLHNNFQYNTLPALERELEETNYSNESIRHFLGVCIGWLITHTQVEDQAIVGRGVNRWVNLPYEEEVNALKQTLIRLLDDMFPLQTKIVSENYEGEAFGKVVCSRYIYSGMNGEKWELFLSFEEKLLLMVVGDMLNKQFSKVDEMVMNIHRYIALQVFEKLRECFPSVGLCDLESESLLTQEQMVKSFDRSHPACSLLFDTGEGYFAFCVNSSDSVSGKISPSMNEENAMSEIKKYLRKSRRKILIVDDSDFMRQNIVSLLKEDYKMMESSSGVSAIRKIATNRPDLILLDYEMPVCDGKQMLEMIRSDKDIADIPVFFLTGRSDRESVKKVMSLKPEGYLLKTLSSEDIKKTIDDFFAKKEQI